MRLSMCMLYACVRVCMYVCVYVSEWKRKREHFRHELHERCRSVTTINHYKVRDADLDPRMAFDHPAYRKSDSFATIRTVRRCDGAMTMRSCAMTSTRDVTSVTRHALARERGNAFNTRATQPSKIVDRFRQR